MKIKLFLAVLSAACMSIGISTSAWAAPFTVSADFAEVTDTATGLIWRRCAEGAAPDATGNCIGASSALTHEAALGVAKTAAASTGKAWRLPSVRELGSLLNTNTLPAIDTAAFPSAPAISTWTSSPAATDSTKAWAVDFYIAFIYNEPRTATNRVRLVRTAP